MSLLDLGLGAAVVTLLFVLWAVRHSWVEEAAAQYEEAEELTDLLHEVWARTHVWWHEQAEFGSDEWAECAVNAMRDIEDLLLESRFDPDTAALYGDCDLDRELAFIDEDDE